jgi:inorganic pyrophosphatase
MKRLTWQIVAVFGVLTVGTGCKSTYYSTMEKFGYHKRDLLVDRVQDARDAQEQAKEQFQSALEQFTAVVGYEGGELEKTYKRLKNELERSEDRAQAVHKRIADVQDVAKALFREWQAELNDYTNANLKSLSQQRLEQTQERYARLIEAMQRAESRIDPVLASFRDQVLFLKHNLNAQAIASLEDELATVRTEVSTLLKAMETSIVEANDFIKAMGQQ